MCYFGVLVQRHDTGDKVKFSIQHSAGLLTAAVAVLAAGGCASNLPALPATPTACAGLNGLTVAAQAIGLPTTGVVVTSAAVVPAAGAGVAQVAEYCKVLGDINPVDPTAPKIKFQVNLPNNWNGKAMMFGGGGYNGVLATGLGNVPAGPTDKPAPLARGYATFGSDSGHQANANGSRDGIFGANDEALKNFSSDAIKKVRDAAITIIQTRYAAAVQKTYFAGGSTGGRVLRGRWRWSPRRSRRYRSRHVPQPPSS